ncbi:MAG: hypothetical protein U0271_36775 [Polyangiaceae bacterium]
MRAWICGLCIVLGCARTDDHASAVIVVPAAAETVTSATVESLPRRDPDENPSEALRAELESTRKQLEVRRMAVQLWLVAQGSCPTLDDLVANHLVSPKTSPNDAWGTELVTTCRDDDTAEIRSAGPDRQFSTRDDLRSETPPR